MARQSPIGWLRAIGFWEGISFLVLVFVCVPLKYLGGHPIGVHIVGPVHGALFLAVCVAIGRSRLQCGLPWRECAICFFAALLPFGPFLIDPRLKRLDEGCAAS